MLVEVFLVARLHRQVLLENLNSIVTRLRCQVFSGVQVTRIEIQESEITAPILQVVKLQEVAEC